MAKQFLIVGAGFAGSVCARQLADAGHRVVIVDKRDHIGGNAFDTYDGAGVLIHKYGPHIFHTNSKDVFQYLSRFTDWHFYEHKVLARVGQGMSGGVHIPDKLMPVPINATTIKTFYGLNHLPTELEMEKYFSGERVPVTDIKNSEDKLLSTIGKRLTDVFFRGYSRKQWGMDLNELAPSVAARIPYRTNDDDRYFTDNFQFMPAHGYGSLFCEMLRHPNIDIKLNEDATCKMLVSWPHFDHLIWTGPIDEFFGYRHGKLPYRSLKFEHEHLPFKAQFQSVATVNEPAYNIPYTRTTEFKHMTGQDHLGTSICREYPTADGDPYYPIPNAANQAMYLAYENEAYKMNNVATFVGRLAQYKYYNMDQVVASALTAVKKLL